ncbi:MAG: class I SAM-dependent methyltransferase [Planctomycetota bacterium]
MTPAAHGTEAVREPEWVYQWERCRDSAEFLLRDWLAPNSLESFAGLRVLEGGCGGGDHTRRVAPHCRELVSVDLNTASLAAELVGPLDNVRFVSGDLATVGFDEPFDVVFSIGVVHHTDDPDATVANLKRLVRPGGRLILWVYSREGNFLVRHLVERPRRLFLRHLPRPAVLGLSWALGAGITPLAHTLYRLPLSQLPYHAYMGNWRKMSLRRNVSNVFDKLNAPQTQFVSEARARRWADDPDFDLVALSPYMGVSWRLTLRRKGG